MQAKAIFRGLLKESSIVGTQTLLFFGGIFRGRAVVNVTHLDLMNLTLRSYLCAGVLLLWIEMSHETGDPVLIGE